jgi:hypothetical protein
MKQPQPPWHHLLHRGPLISVEIHPHPTTCAELEERGVEPPFSEASFLIDTGASFTMVSEVLLKSWGEAHSDWPRHAGAYGEAKTLGGMTLETMFVPSVRWGRNELKDVGVTSQKSGTFEKWMSSMTKGPIVGSLAGNVLKGFRVELDYANETLYLAR